MAKESKNIDFSCKDWEEKITKGERLIPEGIWNNLSKDGDRALEIFKKLQLPDVVGNPLMGESCGQWAYDLVKTIGGSVDEKGARWCREFFVMVPKKNSKTTIGAAILLTMLLINRRPNAEMLLVSPSLDISALAFGQLIGFIECDEELSILFNIKRHVKTVIFRPTGAFVKIKTCSPSILTGSKPVITMLDECHVIGELNNSDRLYGQIRGGFIANPEGALIVITTQSERQPTGVFASELKKARSVRDGKLNLPICPVLYEFGKNIDWRDSQHWHTVNPNNGYSISVDRLKEDFIGAQSDGEHEIARWASQHLNVEIGIGLTIDTWVGAMFWDKCADTSITLDYILSVSDTIVLGIDGGGMSDLLGAVVLGRSAENGEWLAWFHAWAHPIALERTTKEAQNRYQDFVDDGDLTFSENVGEDFQDLTAIAVEIYESGLLGYVAVDKEGIASILDDIIMAGVPEEKIVSVTQGFKLNGAIKGIERKLAEGKLKHNGSRMMQWCVGNARTETRGSATYVTKQNAAGKIDPLISLYNAASVLALSPERKVDIESWIG